MESIDLAVSIVVTIVGSLLLWANPRRKVNRTVFLTSISVAAWLLCSHLAVTESSLFWLRATYSSGAVAPLTLWMVKEAIAGTLRLRITGWSVHHYFWLGATLALVLVPFTEIFIPSWSTPEARARGIGFHIYRVSIVLLYVRLFYDTIKSVRTQSGARKLELQIWLGGGSTVAVAIYGLQELSRISGNPAFRNITPLAVLLFYVATAYAITSYRIFDARQIFLLGGQKAFIVVASAAIAISADLFLSPRFSAQATIVATTLLVLTTAALLNEWLQRRFLLLPKGDAAREAAFATSQRETRRENLEQAFCELLKRWGKTDHAIILSGTKGQLSGSGIIVGSGSDISGTMRKLKWATPERLVRERSSLERSQIAGFLEKHELGLLVLKEGSTITIAIGVGIAASRRPYTYPQVKQIEELAAIMQAAIERAHFSAKAQHAEQLATVGVLGASLAHEIRNPLVSIKTFVQLLPNHYQDARFRDKFFSLIGSEVNRMDQLTEQLLDLSAPRIYVAQEIALHELLRSSVDLVTAKATHRQIDLLTDFKASPDRAFTDAAAAKQVVINLCFNAIQAVDIGERDERWVKISTRNLESGIEMSVADSGPGISPEIRPRLFQPFQTTKSTGFGLGLAVCSDILSNLSASITVDPLEAGRGAIFRVVFPCQPLSS